MKRRPTNSPRYDDARSRPDTEAEKAARQAYAEQVNAPLREAIEREKALQASGDHQRQPADPL